MYTSLRDLRRAFWQTYFVEGRPRAYAGKTQNDFPADVRMAWCDFVDYCAREGTISERLAQSATL